ncbi:MAG: GNAT family N-acetyltransferase, partial [Campylobacteraceae bacterium]|nr:GNAT family N-acetyltransferase [Campylobacteraceae bacterium]
LVYENNGVIQGWIHFFIANRVASESFVEIGGLVVDSSVRREGIGKSLVEFVKHWAIKNKYKVKVRCNTKREETHIFYDSLGFENKKTQHVFQVIF